MENWSPDYGAPLEVSAESEPVYETDPAVETRDWSPIRGSSRTTPPEVVFVDGVRRVEARITIDDPLDGPVPGLMAAIGVGAVRWDRSIPRSTFSDLSVERLVVMARGYESGIDRIGALPVTSESVPDDDPAELVAQVQRRMRAAEQLLASRLATPGRLVIADGRSHELGPQRIVGLVKTHRAMYLEDRLRSMVGHLRAGERTPIFSIDTGFLPRYSWYLRIAEIPRSHSWTGIVRCEVAGAVGIDAAAEMAGWTTQLLPPLPSEQHIDPRAPRIWCLSPPWKGNSGAAWAIGTWHIGPC